MEAGISAIAGDLISQVISFLIKKYSDKTATDPHLERLQQLLLRIHTIVEEADGLYITNPMMLMQLKLLAASMYRGYHVLDMTRYKFLVESRANEESTMSSSISLKRSRTIRGTKRILCENNHLLNVLENLEAATANMNEFVVLLRGYKCMFRRPYDTYLYINNFMFGRHAEKQQVINNLLQDPERLGPPMVLPIIGGIRVGKKTLFSHICMNDRIRSQFPSIMFINGDRIRRMEHASFSSERTLVVVELLTDVNDDDWETFYSTITRTAALGSKLVIISRIQSLARFRTVKAVFPNSLSCEGYGYLFKILAFGSMDVKDFPQFASIAKELAVVLGGSLITANAIANLLQRNFNLQFWLRILHGFKGLVDNISKYGEHPKDILEDQRPIDITTLISSCGACLRVLPPQVESDDSPKGSPARVSLGELITGFIAVPNDDFVLVALKSRIPPYTEHHCLVVPAKAENECTSTRKRRSSSRHF